MKSTNHISSNCRHSHSKETNYASQMAAQSSEMLGSNFAALLEVQLGEFRFFPRKFFSIWMLFFLRPTRLFQDVMVTLVYIYVYAVCPTYSQIMWVFLLDCDIYLEALRFHFLFLRVEIKLRNSLPFKNSRGLGRSYWVWWRTMGRSYCEACISGTRGSDCLGSKSTEVGASGKRKSHFQRCGGAVVACFFCH